MTKRKTAIVAEPKGRKMQIRAYGPGPTVAPYVRENRYATDPYVWHGKDNLYPEHLRTLVDNCAPLERSITMLAQFIAGEGVRFYDKSGNEIEAAQKRWQEWMAGTTEEEFLFKTAYDMAHGLGMAWVVRRAAVGEDLRAGGRITNLDHIDRLGVRSGKFEKGVGKPSAYYYSDDWCEHMKNKTDEQFTPIEIAAFDATKRQDRAMIFQGEYRPREPYYGRVFWQGALKSAQVWTMVSRYNETQIATGFTGAMLMGSRFEGSDAEWDTFTDDVHKVFTGPDGNALIHFQMGLDEKDPFFQEIKRGNHAGEMDEIATRCADVVYDAFGIPSLLMRDREAGLTAQDGATLMRLQQFQRTTVIPHQKPITRMLTSLMNLEGIPVWECKIDSLKVFDIPQGDAVITATMLVNEARAQRGVEPLKDERGEKLIMEVKPVAQAQPVQQDNPSDPNPSKAA